MAWAKAKSAESVQYKLVYRAGRMMKEPQRAATGFTSLLCGCAADSGGGNGKRTALLHPAHATTSHLVDPARKAHSPRHT